jgi:hypothetical protein
MTVELDPTGIHPRGHSLGFDCAAIPKDTGYGYVAKPNSHTPWWAFSAMFFLIKDCMGAVETQQCLTMDTECLTVGKWVLASNQPKPLDDCKQASKL